MSPTSRSQCTVGMLSIGRVVGGGKEGAFRHSWQRGWLAAWLRHPRKNRSRSSATPARLSLLGGQLRMLMRRGTVSIVAMHERSMLTCRDQQHPSTAHCPAHLVPLPWRRLRGHLCSARSGAMPFRKHLNDAPCSQHAVNKRSARQTCKRKMACTCSAGMG